MGAVWQHPASGSMSARCASYIVRRQLRKGPHGDWKLGPIAANFAGSALVTRDQANWRGTVVGAGTDSGSASRTKGEIVYRLEPFDEGAGTRVDLYVLYNLQGSLSRNSRGRAWRRNSPDNSLPNSRKNCSSQLSGGQPTAAASQPLDLGRMLRLASLAWLK